MAAVQIGPEDLAPFADIDPAKADAMITDAVALATRAAPCIAGADFAYPDAAKAIIRGAILRWNDAGSGAITQQATGPFQQTIERRNMFWPSEITDLQQLCEDASSGQAYTIDTAPSWGAWHAAICAVNFGADYCSCGAELTRGVPLYEEP